MGDNASGAQPFVKWAGGKRALLPQLRAAMPRQFGAYWEPFVGGGAFFFALAPTLRRAHLSDLNQELVTTYRVIRDTPDALAEALAAHAEAHAAGAGLPTAEQEQASRAGKRIPSNLNRHYYEVRATRETDPVAVAARFIYLNRTCFNGLYRENSAGEFNVPLGRYANPAICQPELIAACSAALAGVEVENRPFSAISPAAGDFVYFDPPYDPLDANSFTKYAADDFRREDQVALRDFALALAESGVAVMLSNHNTAFIREIYGRPPFRIQTVEVRRPINSKGASRGAVEEVIVTSYPTA